MTKQYDVVIVGTGAAGLFCALSFPTDRNICVITKENADESNSFLAQGGICVLRGEEDYAEYFEDTMRAGHYENSEDAVEIMIRSSNQIVRSLIQLGVDFDCDADGALNFTKEGAHSQPRILFHQDITGKEITSTLLKRAQECDNITIMEHTMMIDILENDGVCGGIVVVEQGGEPYPIIADNVVLACGGIGGLFENSTNFPHITGDALAIALEHGVEVAHLDYVHIHPTTLYSKKPGRRFLISESVRGEGAILLDKNGERFTEELQPRDLLSKAIRKQMEIDGTDYVLEDLRPIGKEEILEHFPNIYEHCLEEGYNVLEEPIPVVPAQHYHMGGIAVNMASQTNMEGLYAVGEASCNGVHGRNRLASNSLLESLVFAQRAADDILFGSRHSGCTDCITDMKAYSDLDAMVKRYRSVVLEALEN